MRSIWFSTSPRDKMDCFRLKSFFDIIGVTGIIVTKLDGTAKGGIVVAMARELTIPVPFIGIGEAREDLVPFLAEAFVDSLFVEEAT